MRAIKFKTLNFLDGLCNRLLRQTFSNAHAAILSSGLQVLPFVLTLTAATQTFAQSNIHSAMKNFAQAILLFTGHPLEPIVAFQLNKSYQPQAVAASNPTLSFTHPVRSGAFNTAGKKR